MPASTDLTVFLSGDVMTGRGVDQILPHPCSPQIYEPYVQDARDYVALAENVNGAIPRAVPFEYIWGDTLEPLERARTDVRIINLETSVTSSNDYWKGKGINYRMHPANVGCLSTAKIDCCVVANNHVLDWGYEGLSETLKSLQDASLRYAGAGADREEAAAPAVLDVAGKGAVVVLAFGARSSGIPSNWAASESNAGVNLLRDYSDTTIREIATAVHAVKQPRDIVVASIHWGGNWGYEVPARQIEFAHKLIDDADVNVVHGHSAHHPKAVEVYRSRPILYGCGDLINDYEGIAGRESYRNDLGLMYLPRLDPRSGALVRFEIIPTQIRRFQVNRASAADTHWMKATMNRLGQPFGTAVELTERGTLALRWS